MIRTLRNLPIRQKLVLVIMSITGTAILLESTVTLTYDVIDSRREMERELDALSQIIASNASAALTFLDHDAAGQILASLRVQDQILEAQIRDAEGRLFAEYRKEGASAQDSEGGLLFPRALVAEREIRVDAERVGSIRVTSDTSLLRRRVAHSGGAVAGVASGVLLVALLLSSWLERLVSRQLRRLAEAARRVSEARDYAVRVAHDGGEDEVGRLVTTFNEMLRQIQTRDAELEAHRAHLEEEVEKRTAELRESNQRLQREMSEREQLHRKYVRVSREAGMAQIATSVLHNVGNVLNSINVSTSVVTDRIRQSRISGVEKAARLLGEHSADPARFLGEDPGGRTLPVYLEALSRHLTQEQAALLEELDSLRQNLDHVKEIVSTQQAHAKRTRLIETVRLAHVVEEAIRINKAGFERHRVELIRDYAELPAISIDRHRLLEILINLISNAKYAVSPNEDRPRTVIVSIGRSDTREEFARLRVSDNGVGIPPEHLTRIFSYGFTTKREGHGFGLHSSALAAKEMNGFLWVESAGLGAGASFTLDVPLHAVERERDTVSAELESPC